MSPKVSGSAWSPPSPCPKAFGAKDEIVRTPVTARINKKLFDNNYHVRIPYLKMA